MRMLSGCGYYSMRMRVLVAVVEVVVVCVYPYIVIISHYYTGTSQRLRPSPY